MRAKKWLVLITVPVALVALVCLFAFQYCCKIGYDISLAVLGSALLGFVMSLIEYHAEKRRTMETFYVEALNAARVFGKVEYFFPNEPIEMILACIREEDNNKHFTELSLKGSQAIIDLMDLKIESNAKKTLMSFILGETEIALEELESPQLTNWYKEKIMEYQDEIHNCIDSYMRVRDFSLGVLDNAIGNLDFISANRTIRTSAYKNIYNKLRESRYDVVDKARFFKMAKEEEGHLPVCVTMIQELSSTLFKVEKITNEDSHVINVYRQFYDDLCNDIERFRAKIYNHVPTIEESKPFTCRFSPICDKTKESIEDEVGE